LPDSSTVAWEAAFGALLNNLITAIGNLLNGLRAAPTT